MYPEVRAYSDPFEGLVVQITELRGLIKLVPPLIDADRERRWNEIGARPSDGEDGDVIDVYEGEAGAEEGWGHAAFDRTIYVAAVVTGWAVFHDCLGRLLQRGFLQQDLTDHPALAMLVAEDVRGWDRRFEKIEQRYRDFGGIALTKMPSWDLVRHARELRNALVHNQGQYTVAYLKTKLARRPTKEDLSGFAPRDDDGLVNAELIPLSAEFVDGVLTALIEVAGNVRDLVGNDRAG